MAIYHFSAKMISRANGSSALAAAAYRSASRLHDQRLDRYHDFSNKAGVVHSEVMLPDGAPEELADREKLWNAVEAAEIRKDAQLAREIEFAIPRELDQEQGIRLAREFVKVEFVDRGMIADLNVHWDIGDDGQPKPHAHVMLTTRSVDEEGFGPKVRDWNATSLLEQWRERWAGLVNARLAELDIDARVDHRTLEAQRIDLEPQHKIGPAASRMAGQGLESERLAEHVAIARSNGEKILAKPEIALDAITHHQATFTDATDLGVVIGYAGTGKSAMLGVARDAWATAGYSVIGLALSGIAAENLESGSGIGSRTIASMEHQWGQGREQLTSRDILVVDEAGMVGTRQMERIVREAEKANAKLVLVGDPEQLQAIEAGAAFRSIAERHGGVEITAIRRQQEDWQRDATRELATGRTAKAIRAYDEAGHIHAADTREGARRDLIDRWDDARKAAPAESRMILTHTHDEVAELNGLARDRLRAAHELGIEHRIETSRGERLFAKGDRIMFLRNERGLGVKNGSLGIAESVSSARMAVMMDDGRSMAFDVKDYTDIDHGYAATIHKSQGVTIDRVHVLATPGLDRHASYVALSRHRDSVDLHYGRDDFADQGKLIRTLSRERGKNMASDYADSFAERRQIIRRGIDVEQPTRERTPQQTRSMFDGLRLEKSALTRDASPARSEPVRAAGLHADLPQAVTRHGRIVQAIRFAQSVGDKSSPEQKAELAASRAALDRIQPHGARDLESAMAVDQRMIGEAGAGRTNAVIRAMQLDAEMRTDPQLRADTFVQRWQGLERQRRLLLRDHEDSRADRVAQTMAGMAKGLERDPQVDSILRSRRAQLGLPEAPIRSVAESLGELVGRTRSRGLGIGM